MIPPYGLLMVYRGDTGEAVWDEPFKLPNMDEMVERGVAVTDRDGDGWKDLLLGSRFYGGGVRTGVACFVDLVSGRRGKRLWASQVRVEQNELTLGPTELVDLSVVENQGLVSVVTHAGSTNSDFEQPRPYSTTFLNLESGQEKTFGLGIRANAFCRDWWLEHRLAPPGNGTREMRPRPGQLAGWAYPEKKTESIDELTLWSTERYAPMLCADLDRDGYPEVIGSTIEVGYREYSRLDGLTGRKRWSRPVQMQDASFWFEMGEDATGDGTNDLVTMTSNGSPPAQAPSVEIVCGATGKTIWRHTATEGGAATPLGLFKRKSGLLPLYLYQNEGTGRIVTCVDLDSRTTRWKSSGFSEFLETQAFATWDFEDNIIWFSINSEVDAGAANFVNAETGDLLLQIPIGAKLAAPWSDWIQWNGRELLRIQTWTEQPPTATSTDTEYRMDLWLVDRSATIAGHWSETTTASSLAAKNWFQRSHYDLSVPAVITESSGKELLAVPTCGDGSIVLRLLDWEDEATSRLHVDRTVRLPIAPGSALAEVRILDCDGDGLSDCLSISDGGIDCMTFSGKVLWQRPPPPVGSNILYAAREIQGRKYLGIQTDPGYLDSMTYMDIRTGQLDTQVGSDPMWSALNSDKDQHASLITCVYDRNGAKLSAISRTVTSRRETSKQETDPRYVRLLPWAVHAKSFVHSNPVSVQRFSWTRILKLSLGVFLLPLAVASTCFRRRLSLRHLGIMATTIAVALSLALADRHAYPADLLGRSYLRALETAAGIAVVMFLFALPIIELMRKRRRRNLSLLLYGTMLVVVPGLTLWTNASDVIPTTYAFNESWHLFWFALLPTGAMLFLIHSLRIAVRAMACIFTTCRLSFKFISSSIHAKHEISGDANGG